MRTEPDSADSSSQARAVSAAFELKGDSQQGELLLLTPLGSTAALIRWSASGAQLQARGQTRQFGDLQQLVTEILGSSVPVTALFYWLNGQATSTEGWMVDLSEFERGKISARRDSPAPTAELRIILTR